MLGVSVAPPLKILVGFRVDCFDGLFDGREVGALVVGRDDGLVVGTQDGCCEGCREG